MHFVEHSFRVIFAGAYAELDQIKRDIHKKTGFWITEHFVISKKEILNDERFRTVHMQAAKAGHFFEAFFLAGQLSPEHRKLFMTLRRRLDSKINKIKDEAAARGDMPVNKVIAFFEGLIQAVRKIVPTVKALEKEATKLLEYKPQN